MDLRRLTKHLLVGLCTLPSIVVLSLATPHPAPASLIRRSSDEQQTPMYTMNVTDAHNFEQSYKAHPSVANDSFYTVPAGTADRGAGSLLKLEAETDTTLYTLAPNLALSRFMYQSITSNGTLVPVSAYVLWPYAARPHVGGFPVVAWAHGTSGSAAECAPSNIQNLWHHFQAPYQLALYGYVVVATDYAGLGVATDASGNSIIHEYITGKAQANDVYYSIMAARQAFAELSDDVVVIGSSEGGGAAWSFAEKLVNEPLSGHLGTVALSPITRMLDLPLDEPIIPFLLLYLTPTLQRNYGEFKAEDIFTPQGMQSLKTLYELNGCSTVIFQLMGDNLLKEGWESNTAIQRYQEVGANGGRPISGPMLVIQGGADPIIHTPTVEAAVNETVKNCPECHIEYHLMPNVTHAPAMYAGLSTYVDWISARFDGKPTKPGYQSSVAKLARPAASQQAEANWFIQKQQYPYQQT